MENEDKCFDVLEKMMTVSPNNDKISMEIREETAPRAF
jgi:hypothetical protein